jgi:hypothetical protein
MAAASPTTVGEIYSLPQARRWRIPKLLKNQNVFTSGIFIAFAEVP